MLNTDRIKGRIKELKMTQADVAKALDLSTATICQKLNGYRPMTLDEANKIAELLDIGQEDFGKYFFSSKIA